MMNCEKQFDFVNNFGDHGLFDDVPHYIGNYDMKERVFDHDCVVLQKKRWSSWNNEGEMNVTQIREKFDFIIEKTPRRKGVQGKLNGSRLCNRGTFKRVSQYDIDKMVYYVQRATKTLGTYGHNEYQYVVGKNLDGTDKVLNQRELYRVLSAFDLESKVLFVSKINVKRAEDAGLLPIYEKLQIEVESVLEKIYDKDLDEYAIYKNSGYGIYESHGKYLKDDKDYIAYMEADNNQTSYNISNVVEHLKECKVITVPIVYHDTKEYQENLIERYPLLFGRDSSEKGKKHMKNYVDMVRNSL